MSGASRWCRWAWSTTGCTMVRAAPAMHTATGERVARWAARATFETFSFATFSENNLCDRESRMGGLRGQSAQPHTEPPNAATVAGQVRRGCPGAPLESSKSTPRIRPRMSSAPASIAWPSVAASTGRPRRAHTPRSAQSIAITPRGDVRYPLPLIFWCAWVTPIHPTRRSGKLSVQKRSKAPSHVQAWFALDAPRFRALLPAPWADLALVSGSVHLTEQLLPLRSFGSLRPQPRAAAAQGRRGKSRGLLVLWPHVRLLSGRASARAVCGVSVMSV